MTNQRREQRARFGAPSLDALIGFMLDNVMPDGTSHMVYYGSGEPNVALSSLAMDIVEHKASVDAAMIMAVIREIEEIGLAARTVATLHGHRGDLCFIRPDERPPLSLAHGNRFS